jgi:drug/metabolite transporter superfamily protein YnfA
MATSSALENKTVQLLVLLLAAVFEVGGDALIRAGMRGKALFLIALGFVILGSYGLTLNQLEIDFSKLLGVYVGVFALVSILFGRYLFHETIPFGVWAGVGIILVGSAVIQWS